MQYGLQEWSYILVAMVNKYPTFFLYRVNKLVDFDEKFDPEDVMIGSRTWDDCNKKPLR